jgi:hypothetical protein
MRIAAVTMVYNEPDYLPIWLRYYSGQVGAGNCFVIDHGTDDGSTNNLPGVNLTQLPRSPFDDTKRAGLVSTFVASLLQTYDAVIHTDVDEIVFADPRLHPSLASFCAANHLNVVTAHGFEIYQLRGSESAFDPARPVLAQRRWAGFSAAMCKPVLVRKPVTWAPGFHCTADPITVSHLYLFHLRWFDFAIALRRLARTRAQPWADPNAGGWQRLPDEEYEKAFIRFEATQRLEHCDFVPDHEPMLGMMAQVLESQIGRESHTYRIDLEIRGSALWRIPECFRGVF